MKIGSLVECVDNRHIENEVKLNTPYTVRRIIEKFEVFIVIDGLGTCVTTDRSIYLEEVKIIRPLKGLPIEVPAAMIKFRELLPPIENIEETINQNTIVIKPELV